MRRLFYIYATLMLCAFGMFGQALTIGLPANVNTLDPHMSGSVGTDLSVAAHLYSSLVRRNADLQIVPSVAVSWRNLDDVTWEFTLKSGIQFPDGEPLDSSTVRWNLLRILDKKNGSRIRPWFTSIDRIEATSPTILRLHTRSPMPSLLAQLTMLFLLPPEWASTHSPAVQALGTGPYALDEFVPGDHITLSLRAGAPDPKPAFRRVTFRILNEPGGRTFALLNHEVDYVKNLPIEDITRVNSRRGLHASVLSGSRATIIKFNTLRPPFQNNTALRQALNYAVDKQAIRDTILHGSTELLNCQVLTPSYFGYNRALQPIPFDPKKAQDLFKTSGVPHNTILDLDVPVGTYFEDDTIAQAVAGQIEEVLGIGVRIHEMDFGLYMTKYIKGHNMASMEYISQAWPSLDADGLLTLFAPDSPYAYWNDSVFAKYLHAGNATTDPLSRLQAYKKATERMCEEAPALFLFAEPLSFGISKRVLWHQRPDDWVLATDFSLVESSK